MLASTFKPDFICYNNIIVELKAVKELDDTHRSQAINYGKVAGGDIAILINFGETSLKFERYVIKKKKLEKFVKLCSLENIMIMK